MSLLIPFSSDIAIFVLKRDVKLQLTNYFTLIGVQRNAVSVSVCRLHPLISQTTCMSKFCQIFLYVLPVAMVQSSLTTAQRHLLPILPMTSCFQIIESE